jgi:hypothetical protein
LCITVLEDIGPLDEVGIRYEERVGKEIMYDCV